MPVKTDDQNNKLALFAYSGMSSIADAKACGAAYLIAQCDDRAELERAVSAATATANAIDYNSGLELFVELSDGELKPYGKTHKCMFEDHVGWPEELTAIFAKYSDELKGGGPNYALCKAITIDVEAIGYTVDYDLSGEVYDLRPLGTLPEEQ